MLFWRILVLILLISPIQCTFRLSFGQDHQPDSSQRTFILLNRRKDFITSVAAGFRSIGLLETDNIQAADVIWDLQWVEPHRFRDPRIKNTTLVNSIPGLVRAVGKKAYLSSTHHDCVAAHGYVPCSFVAPSFIYPIDYVDFLKYVRSSDYSGGPLWICKPTNAFSGRNVFVIDATKNVCPSHLNQWVMQQYINRILLWNGFKFDLRVWILVTSVSPLRIYMVDRGWIKLASKRYDPDPAKWSDMCMHSTAPKAVSEECEQMNEDVMLTAPVNTADPEFTRQLAPYSAMLTGKTSDLQWDGDGGVWTRIQWTCISVLLMAWDKLLMNERILQQDGFQFRKFSLLSYDIILEEDGTPLVEEVNTNGFYVGAWEEEEFVDGQIYLEDAFRLVGAEGYMREKYQDQVSRMVAHYCQIWDLDAASPTPPPSSDPSQIPVLGHCTQHDLHVLRDAEDEYQHQGSWTRVYPPVFSSNELSTTFRYFYRA